VHEFEDYIDCLKETFEDDIDYLEECRKTGNVAGLDKYALNGTIDVPHIYAVAVRVWRNYLKEE
jgi:hypothetical protein